jgi:hypothetical protein
VPVVQVEDAGGVREEHFDLGALGVAALHHAPPAGLLGRGAHGLAVDVDDPGAGVVAQERPAVVEEADLLGVQEVLGARVAALAAAAPAAHEGQQRQQVVVQVGPAAEVVGLLERVGLDLLEGRGELFGYFALAHLFLAVRMVQ